MKPLLIILLTVLLALGSVSISGAGVSEEVQNLREELAAEIPEGCTESIYGKYSYQGLMDPQTITENWTIIEEKCRLVGPSIMELYYQNPDMPCEIPVAVFLVFEGIFLGFAYLHGGNVYLYLLDLDSMCYLGKQLEGDAEPRFKKKLGEALGQKSL